MNTLVTGATGCVGANIVRRLNAYGIEPKVLLRKTSKTIAIDDLRWSPVIGDLTDPFSLRQAVKGCSVVFHAAGMISFWRGNWNEMMNINVEGTRSLLEVCKKSGVREFVFTSSIVTLGFQKVSSNCSRFLVYHAAKKRAEQYVLEANREEFRTFTINPGLIFGERDVNMHAASYFKVLKKARIPFACKGTVLISDADDVAEAHIRVLERGTPGRSYIIGNQTLCRAEILEEAARLLGQKPPIGTFPGWVVMLAGYIGEAYGFLFRMEPPISYESALMANSQIYGCGDKARDTLGLSLTPAKVSMRKSFKWALDKGLL